MKKRRTIRNIILSVVLLVALAIFGISGYKLYSYISEADKEKQAVNMLSDNAVKIYIDTSSDNTSLFLDVDFDYLKTQNEDIKAWLYCPDTPINYPVAQSDDNEFYLHRLTDKTYNSAGTLFIDYRNTPDFSDLVTIIYGHNMKNNTMFGSLDLYKDSVYYEQHPLMYLATPYNEYTVELISGYVTDADSDTYIIPTTVSERNDYINDTIKHSCFDSGITTKDIAANDKIVILSTCSYEYENARFVVVGMLNKM
jgi:sortase B